MAIKFYHPKSGKSADPTGPVPPAGWIRAEELIDTASGHRMWISAEPSSNSGQGVAQALSARRSDAGHEGEPAFMTLEHYARLPEMEKQRLIAAPISVPKSMPEQQLAAKDAELAALKAQLAALQPQPQKGR
jgi:hypothetical protein